MHNDKLISDMLKKRKLKKLTKKLVEDSPCPFCAFIETTVISVLRDEGDGYYVECLGCDAHGPICHKRKDAIAMWNKRSISTTELLKQQQKAIDEGNFDNCPIVPAGRKWSIK